MKNNSSHSTWHGCFTWQWALQTPLTKELLFEVKRRSTWTIDAYYNERNNSWGNFPSGNFSSNISWLLSVFSYVTQTLRDTHCSWCSLFRTSHLGCHNHLPVWALGPQKHCHRCSWDLHLNLLPFTWLQHIASHPANKNPAYQQGQVERLKWVNKDTFFSVHHFNWLLLSSVPLLW